MSNPNHAADSSKAIPSCLDPDIVNSLLELAADDSTLIPDLVSTFLADTPSRLDAMLTAARTADAPALERSAHSLKSSAGNLGAKMLAESCRQLENKGRVGDLSDVESLVIRAKNEFVAASDALRRLGRT
jgi:histidine phosphotransfer protein HptB